MSTTTRAMDYFRAAYLATRLPDATDVDAIHDALEELERIGNLSAHFAGWQIDHEGAPLLGKIIAHYVITARYVMDGKATVADLILILMTEGYDDQLAIEIGNALDNAVHTFPF